jgi:SAM-dependent methyltransferase
VNPLRRAYLWLVVPPDPFRFDPRLEEVVRGLLASVPSPEPVLNLGSGSTAYGSRVLNVDLQPFPGVQVVGDGERLPFRARSFAGVLLRGVFEHVRSAERLRDEVQRVLKPGGFVYVEVPFLQPYHLSPEDHRRFTLPGLKAFLADFEEAESGVQIGPFSALAWMLQEAVAALLSLGSPALYRRLRTPTGWGFFWLKYLDRWVAPSAHVAHAASAVYFLGRKKPGEPSPR